MPNPWEIYERLLDEVSTKASDFSLESINIGLTWTLCRLNFSRGLSSGLSMSPAQYTRTLPWSGELKKYSIKELCEWIRRWDSFESVVAQSVINAVINSDKSSMLSDAVAIGSGSESSGSSNLSVFKYFSPHLKNKKIVVIGHYPGIEQFQSSLDLSVLERSPLENDYPDNACEYLIPEADWVFVTASAIANKTFPRLVELAQNAVTVLMGPSVPWSVDFKDFGVDFLAGIKVSDADELQATVAEGGGVRIFNKAVQYQILDIGNYGLHELKNRIAELVSQRDALKTEMESWYKQNASGNPKRFPKWKLLEQTDRELSLADTRYKRQWDARNMTIE